jgi:hypothetical protein
LKITVPGDVVEQGLGLRLRYRPPHDEAQFPPGIGGGLRNHAKNHAALKMLQDSGKAKEKGELEGSPFSPTIVSGQLRQTDSNCRPSG